MDIDSHTHTHTASGEALGRSSLHPPKKRHKAIGLFGRRPRNCSFDLSMSMSGGGPIAIASSSQSPHNNCNNNNSSSNNTNTNTGNYSYNFNFNQREQRTAPAACNSSVASSSCYNNVSALEHETASLASYSTSMTASRCCPSSPNTNINMNTSLSASSPSTHGLLPAYIIAIPPIPNLRDADCSLEEDSDRVSILPTSMPAIRRYTSPPSSESLLTHYDSYVSIGR